METFVVDNPATETPFCERTYLPTDRLASLLAQSTAAFEEWRRTPLTERIELLEEVAKLFEARRSAIANDITSQMGKPLIQAEGEVDGMLFRLRSLCEQAPAALADVELPEKPPILVNNLMPASCSV